jgi:hypothetical protein
VVLEDLGLEPSYVVMTAVHVGDPLEEILPQTNLVYYTLEFITNRSAAPVLTAAELKFKTQKNAG